LQWRLGSLVWLVLIAGVVLGIIRYGQDHAARTNTGVRPVYLTLKAGDGLTPGTELLIFQAKKPSQERAMSPKR
jgi:hypothetical protein